MNIPGKNGNSINYKDGNLPELLYKKHAPAMLGVCLRYCGNVQDAEDVLHEAFIKIIRNIGSFKDRGEGSFLAWMKRIMVNTALNYIRDHSRERKFLSIDDGSERVEEDSEDDGNLISVLSERLDPNVIMDMICELPAGYRTVFNLYVFESWSHKEISQSLHCSENTSKSQLSKARAMLRKRLSAMALTKTEYHEKV